MTKQRKEFLFIVLSGMFSIFWLFLSFTLSAWANRTWTVRDVEGTPIPITGILTFIVCITVGVCITMGSYAVWTEDKK